MCSKVDLGCPITTSGKEICGRRYGEIYKIPAVVVDRGNFGLEIDAALTRDDVVVTKALVPRSVCENALAVHVNPGLLESQNATSCKVDTTVVEVVSHRDLVHVSHGSRGQQGVACSLTKALQFLILQTWPIYAEVSTMKLLAHASFNLRIHLTL